MPLEIPDHLIMQSTKTYEHNVGLSCCFRQWRAESHCRFLHGYALKVKFVFESSELDYRNWVVDFGGLKNLKGFLEDLLDHKTLIASDDPELTTFRKLDADGLIQLREVPSAGCEALAYFIYEYAEQFLKDAGWPHVTLVSVEVAEHAGNSAVCRRRE